MSQSTLTTLYAAVLHLAALAAVTVLVALGKIPSDVGLPIISGLVGAGVGAGTALIQPGTTSTPSGAPDPSPMAGSAAPAPTSPLAAAEDALRGTH